MKKYIIIGASAAGISAAKKICELDKTGLVICLTDEKERPYNKCFLSDGLSLEKKTEDINLKIDNILNNENFSIIFNEKIIEIDSKNQIIKSNSNLTFKYDKLLLAFGSQTKNFNIDNLGGVFNFYKMSDLLEIENYLSKNKINKILIVGSGLSGLEAADALKKRNFNISILEKNDQILLSLIDKDASNFIEKIIASHNVNFYKNRTISKISKSSNLNITLSNGLTLEFDMIIFACGATTEINWLKDSEIKISNGSIVTDEFLRTSVNNIFAAGDCALVKDFLTGQPTKSSTWPDAISQGICAAHSMISIEKRYEGVMKIISSSFFGFKFFSYFNEEASSLFYDIKSENESFVRLFLNEKQIIIGFILIDQNIKFMPFKKAVIEKTSIENFMKNWTQQA